MITNVTPLGSMFILTSFVIALREIRNCLPNHTKHIMGLDNLTIWTTDTDLVKTEENNIENSRQNRILIREIDP